MIVKRVWIAIIATLVCLSFAGATGAGRPHPASAGGVIDPTCTSSLPCIEYDNNGTGPGIRGISVSGNGLAGATKFNSTSATNAREGLIGNDISTSGSFNSGVKGLSTRGNGVFGQSTSGTGVTATSISGNGLDSSTLNSSTHTGFGANGVVGIDDSIDGGTLNIGVHGLSPNGTALRGDSTNGTALLALSDSGIGANISGGSATLTLPALSIVGNSGANLLDACQPGAFVSCNTANAVLYVDSKGDVITQGVGLFLCIGVNGGCNSNEVDVGGNVDITGEYRHNGTCVLSCFAATPKSPGRAVTSYSAQETFPTIEDFGEAQLVNGQASVQLDPKFSNVVDQRSNYLVFITPEGDANTLYVTQKSMGGFAVRESHGGRSTLMFSYRIVAKPYGSREARLPMVELPKLRASLPKQRTWHPGGVVPVR